MFHKFHQVLFLVQGVCDGFLQIARCVFHGLGLDGFPVLLQHQSTIHIPALQPLCRRQVFSIILALIQKEIVNQQKAFQLGALLRVGFGTASDDPVIIRGFSIGIMAFFSVLELGKRSKTAHPRRERIFKEKMKKSQNVTEIYFAEAGPVIDILTYNADLKRRLTRYAERHPDLCHQTDDDGLGGERFEIRKGRFCFRLTEPYSEERREAASRYARERQSSERLNKSNHSK